MDKGTLWSTKAYLASQVIITGHFTQSFKVFFIATVTIATFAPLGITVFMGVTPVNRGHANAMGHPAPLIMPKTLGSAP